MTPSACNNGWGAGPVAYACPHQAMLSDDMVLASRHDRLDAFFDYATAGSGTDAECGTCYQVELLDAERVWNPDSKQLIVQVINSGFDVMPGQLDLFMGAGGFGYFTACNSDCGQRFCQGGPCAEGMYSGTFDDWTNARYMDPNACYSGGIKWLNESSQEDVEALCLGLGGNDVDAFKSIVTYDSCVRTNRALYHQNFVSTNYARVQCPESLYRLTGLQREDDAQFPPASPSLPLTQACRGSRGQGRYCVTTMQDCCVPSCSWPGKVQTTPDYPRVDRCDREGRPI